MYSTGKILETIGDVHERNVGRDFVTLDREEFGVVMEGVRNLDNLCKTNNDTIMFQNKLFGGILIVTIVGSLVGGGLMYRKGHKDALEEKRKYAELK